VIGYLVARPARDIIRLARQQLTLAWWEQRGQYSLFISPTVLDEIRRGDESVARRRLRVAEELPVLPITPEVDALADHLLRMGAVPLNAKNDAYHIAAASVHGMDLLVTWNQAHIANMVRMDAIREAVRQRCGSSPVIIRPGDLLEGDHAI